MHITINIAFNNRKPSRLILTTLLLGSLLAQFFVIQLLIVLLQTPDVLITKVDRVDDHISQAKKELVAKFNDFVNKLKKESKSRNNNNTNFAGSFFALYCDVVATFDFQNNYFFVIHFFDSYKNLYTFSPPHLIKHPPQIA
jgi:hypothetical protein